ncbi:phospholipase D-like domain-containing protein [Natronogracilivirga saccharolytica]|uniref:PLD phosphodiesterase domain-containing protein n=1 Tax=Natronogracilivirga saccharolytica TaxID=2812953 RepID=A0A8J7UWK7_9BACT|nr:hypothetical protein [Natronogracilivirga saccharolytica]
MIYVTGTLFFFNATPESLRVTTPIGHSYSVNDPAFKTNSGILTGRQWVEGNDAMLLSRGKDIFNTMYEDIRNARNSISKETFVYSGEEVATTMAHELADASKRGADVHFIMDYLGSADVTTDQLKIMEDAGVQLVRWRKPAWYQVPNLNHRTHRKLLIIDGEVAYTGGVNTADEWLDDIQEGGYKDYHLRITGPVVHELQGAFSKNWVASRGELLRGDRYYPHLETTGNLSMQVTTSHPGNGSIGVRKMMLHAIASADESIRIGSAYFFPDDKFLQALVDAANRGVHIKILTPNETIDKSFVRMASHTLWGQLLDAGIEMHEYQPVMYHAKLMIVDEYFITIGSTNFDNRSFRLNDEVNVSILDEDFARQMTVWYEKDLAQSERITMEVWENRSFFCKAYGWVIAIVMGVYL